MSELTTPPPEETKATPPQIKSSRELAEKLGFKLDAEQSRKFEPKYVKPITLEGGGEGELVLDILKLRISDKPYQTERPEIGVRISKNSSWRYDLNQEILPGKLQEAGFTPVKGALAKSELKSGGYDRIRDLLATELEEGGDIYMPRLENFYKIC